MTIEELTTALSQYHKDLDLSEIKVFLSVEKEPHMNRIKSAYLADHRIAGGKPWGYLYHIEQQTNLKEVATSLLHGLKMNCNGIS